MGAGGGGFRGWRARRPFWGGVLLTLGGGEILLTEKASMKVVLHVGMQGVAGYLLPTVMVLCGVLTLLSPGQRLFYSLVGALSALGTWLTSNLGGFLVGLLLGLVGACLIFGWMPDQEPRGRWLRRRNKQNKRNRGAERDTAPTWATSAGAARIPAPRAGGSTPPFPPAP
ncbi:hypothetical protein QFZ63_002237 [Streptomyces sp. B3I7]|uniref:DUF6114 domain-containing protein n=1 Tax=Streptomyces sp. B3I7 TaxID=3042269 RepID=UPI00277F1BCA|nr:DUF6114 domain-containing protein [Streptomyces sp. B3I7]MDQ0810523.1 hypothetical protein [Streptomyces sp. B3I7]